MLGRENITVRLKITSSTLTAADIEARLGMKPDESWKLGDKTGVFGAIEKAHCYALVSTPMPTASLDEHVQSILRRAAPVAAKIGEFAAQAKIQMICTIQRKTLPPISLGRDDVRWLGVMGAQLDVEVTLMPDPAREALRGGGAAGDPAKKPPTTGF
ncbi:MAG: hypothetical protein A2V88_13135 [Elusimicrobia bacterium RBG_16_66_12]|nr:MAG: hypothetical protein A2V88_13135 [Elusimicrobia bacterium RBG_16_66_12]